MSRVERDYYDVLGVPRDAGARELKRAFRSLARRHHPDVSNDAEAHERFNEVVEAYAVLSKPVARLLYDRYGYVSPARGLFVSASDARSQRPPAASAQLDVEFVEAERGATRTVRVTAIEPCSACGASGATPGTTADACPECGGDGRLSRSSTLGSGRLLQIETCPRCRGGGRFVRKPCPECGGTGRTEMQRTVTVRIPAGVRGGERIRVSGIDLLLRVLPDPDSRLVRYASAAALVLAVALFVFLLVSPL